MNRTERSLEILCLETGATKDQVKAAFREMIQISHPDRFQDNEALRKRAEAQTRLVVQAYEFLSESADVAPDAEPDRPAAPEGPVFTAEQRRRDERQDERRAARERDEEAKERQHAAYLRRKLAREEREARHAREAERFKRNERKTILLGLVFVALLVAYMAFSYRGERSPYDFVPPDDPAPEGR